MGMQPKLRFKGFTDDWEKRRLGDVVNKVRSYSLSRDVECNKSTGYKYIHYGDIHTGVADIINKKSVLPNIKPNQYDTLSVNDLIVADASEDYQGIASPAVIQALPDENLVAGLHTIALRPQDTNATFLYYLLHTGNFKHFGYRAGTGLKVFGISWPNLSKFEFNLPSQKEQDKVVDLLRLLDNLVVVNQRKVDLLKRKKAGYLQKLFPKNGQNNPELRFKGYTDAWEKRRLRDISKISAGGDVNKDKLTKIGKYPVLANSLTNDGIIGYYEDYKVKAPAVTVTGRGDVGHAKARHIGYTPTVRLLSVQSDDFDVNFLENSINHTKIFIESTGVPQLTSPQLGSVYITFPSLKEQTIIGKFLRNLDNLIAVNQRKVDLLKREKKALLQKMFV